MRILQRIFYQPSQYFIILIGVILIAISAMIAVLSQKSTDTSGGTASSVIRIAESATFDIGISFMATGLVVKLLSELPPNKKLERITEAGLEFIGDRLSFNTFYSQNGENGWDWWIKQTPARGKIIVCGKKNGRWISDSWATVKLMTRKEREINFVFVGSKAEIERHLLDFLNRAPDVKDTVSNR